MEKPQTLTLILITLSSLLCFTLNNFSHARMWLVDFKVEPEAFYFLTLNSEKKKQDNKSPSNVSSDEHSQCFLDASSHLWFVTFFEERGLITATFSEPPDFGHCESDVLTTIKEFTEDLITEKFWWRFISALELIDNKVCQQPSNDQSLWLLNLQYEEETMQEFLSGILRSVSVPEIRTESEAVCATENINKLNVKSPMAINSPSALIINQEALELFKVSAFQKSRNDVTSPIFKFQNATLQRTPKPTLVGGIFSLSLFAVLFYLTGRYLAHTKSKTRFDA